MDQQEQFVDQAGGQQRPDELAAAGDRQIGPIGLFELATPAAGSPDTRIEFCQGSGSVSVLLTTYLVTEFRYAVNGLLSVWWGQKPAKFS